MEAMNHTVLSDLLGQRVTITGRTVWRRDQEIKGRSHHGVIRAVVFTECFVFLLEHDETRVLGQYSLREYTVVPEHGT